jgi:hypothetical protein
LDHLPWKLQILPSIGIELRVQDFENIQKIIQSSIENDTLRENRNRAKAEAWEFVGESGEQIAKFLIEKQMILHRR